MQVDLLSSGRLLTIEAAPGVTAAYAGLQPPIPWVAPRIRDKRALPAHWPYHALPARCNTSLPSRLSSLRVSLFDFVITISARPDTYLPPVNASLTTWNSQFSEWGPPGSSRGWAGDCCMLACGCTHCCPWAGDCCGQPCRKQSGCVVAASHACYVCR